MEVIHKFFLSLYGLQPHAIFRCRLPVDGAADVRAAADAAAEAMASRFAGRKATHAAHAKPVAGPETPNQSREPTPRDGDAQPQVGMQ